MISQTFITMDSSELEKMIKIHYGVNKNVISELAEEYNIGPYGCFWYIKVEDRNGELYVSNDKYLNTPNTTLDTWIEEAEEAFEDAYLIELGTFYYICKMMKEGKLQPVDTLVWIEY